MLKCPVTTVPTLQTITTTYTEKYINNTPINMLAHRYTIQKSKISTQN
jgi:hypothetical protein